MNIQQTAPLSIIFEERNNAKELAINVAVSTSKHMFNLLPLGFVIKINSLEARNDNIAQSVIKAHSVVIMPNIIRATYTAPESVRVIRFFKFISSTNILSNKNNTFF